VLLLLTQMASAPDVEVDSPAGRRRSRARSRAERNAIGESNADTEAIAESDAIGESNAIGESDADTEAIGESDADTEAIGEIDAGTEAAQEAAVVVVSKKRKLAIRIGHAEPAPGARADPDPTPFASYADRIASIACADPPGPSTSAVPPPHPYADRICVNRRARNGQGEVMPYGHCTLDYNKEFDYNVGDSLSSVFGIGSVLMSSDGVEVRGNVSVPRSLDPGRLLKIYYPRSSTECRSAHVFRVV
jgi:hypothetical protein